MSVARRGDGVDYARQQWGTVMPPMACRAQSCSTCISIMSRYNAWIGDGDTARLSPSRPCPRGRGARARWSRPHYPDARPPPARRREGQTGHGALVALELARGMVPRSSPPPRGNTLTVRSAPAARHQAPARREGHAADPGVAARAASTLDVAAPELQQLVLAARR